MTEQDFADLLKLSEGETIDFKADQYDFCKSDSSAKERARACFVKDILCLANTPRETDAYIVLGVKNHPDGQKNVLGMTGLVDDAVFQDQIGDWIMPHPKISYHPVIYEDKSCGVLKIHIDRPHGPYLYFGKGVGGILEPEKIYFRRNSKNATADQIERKDIYSWFCNDSPKTLNISSSLLLPWDKFLTCVDSFNQRRSFIMLLPPIEESLQTEELASLGMVDWFFVADFDPVSQKQGPLAMCKQTLEARRGLHMLTKGNRIGLSPRGATYWYFP